MNAGMPGMLAPASEMYVRASDRSGAQLYVRSRRPANVAPRGVVVLVHGATVASSLFDVPLQDYSLLGALARAGYAAYALDIRGYGRSSRPYLSTGAALPFARGDDAVQDVFDVVSAVRDLEGVERVNLLGGSWGSIVVSKFAAMHPSFLDSLMLMAPIYAERNPGWLADLADPERSDRPRPFPAWRWVTRDDLLRRWDREIPYDDKGRRRDKAVFDWIFDDLNGCEPDADGTRFRAPNGTLLDLFAAFSGTPQFDPAGIQVPTLLLRGEHDGTSTHSDATALFARLGTPDKTYVQIGDAGHFLCVERRRAQFHAHLMAFLDR